MKKEIQQKQELLKKAVGVENIYDDGTPSEQEEQEQEQSQPDSHDENLVDQIRLLSGLPVAALQELSNDDIFDD